MFTQEDIGEGFALNKFEENRKKALKNLLQKRSFCIPSNSIRTQSVVKASSFFKVKKFVNAFQRDVLSDDDTKRFAFYHAGKCLVQTLLLRHPKKPLFKLTEPKNGIVSSNKPLSRDLISGNEKLLSIETRINLETLLIGFYAGKVGEFFNSRTTQHTTQLKKGLFLTTTQRNTLFRVFNNKNSKQSVTSAQPFHGQFDQLLYQSDIGLSECVRATSLVKHRLVNGSIYSANLFNLQKNSVLGNLNKTEILERKLFVLFQGLEEEMNTVYGKQHRHNQKNEIKLKSIRNGSSISHQNKNEVFVRNKALSTTHFFVISQNKETSAWCEEIVCKALTFYRKPYGHWFRIYLPQIETHQRQPASLDKFFTKSREWKVLPETMSIANTFHSRRLQSFALLKAEQSINKAKLCLSPIQVLPCMKMSAKTKLPENRVCVSDQSQSLKKLSKNKLLIKQKQGFCYAITKHRFVKFKTSNLDEHSKTMSTRLETRLQPSLSSALNINLFQSTYLKKAEFYSYTNLACNSNKKVTQTLTTKTEFLFDLCTQEFGDGTSHSLLLNIFSRAFNIIGKNRELLDILADHFIRFGKIRMPEILRICSLYVDMANRQKQSYVSLERIGLTEVKL